MKLLHLGLCNISSESGEYSGTGTYGWAMASNTLAKLSLADFGCTRMQFVVKSPLTYTKFVTRPKGSLSSCLFK
jgi:hypothetical protein